MAERNTMKRRFISLFIIFAMLFSNSSVFAVGLDEASVIKAEQTASSEAEVLAEDVSKRSEYEKHYLRSDGTYVAVSYNDSIHYKDENGDWQDVDNQLSLDTKDGKYKNGTPSFRTEFRSATSKGSLAKISSDGGDITWSLSVNTTLSTVKNAITSKNIEDVPVSAVLKNAEADKTDKFALTKVQGGIEYRNVFANAPEVTVNYSVYHNRVEEDLYFNSQTNVTDIKMEMHLGDLSASVNSDGSVSIVDNDGNLKYRIGIPYMQDASDNVLYDIEVRASQNGEYCTITYTPNKAWLTSSERTYPILFDPSITTSEYNSNVHDTYVKQGSTADNSTYRRLYVGVDNNGSLIARSYIKFLKLPEIDSTMPIISAELTFSMYITTTTGKTTGLYKVTSAWDQNTITYANQPTIGQLIDTSDYNGTTNKHVFDLTDYIHDMYEYEAAGTNYGFLFRYVDESLNDIDYNSIYSSDEANKAYRPALKIVYGYSMPENLQTNKEYYFENQICDGYLTVCGGVDANDVNVGIAASNNSASQKFKLVQAANGGYYIQAVCSSNNRVLDIYKNDETGYVENGCNVQIYNPTDPLAQEWFIIGVSSTLFRIVPRTDMSLALTANSGTGTADGKSITSPGNVYVSTFTSIQYQFWRIIDVATSETITCNTRTIADGIYYLNNKDNGKYLYRAGQGTTVTVQNGLVADLGDNIKWNFQHVRDGGHIIRPYSDLTKYWGPSTDGVGLFDITSEEIPDSYLWEFIPVGDGGYLIRNCGTGQYVRYSGYPQLYSNPLPESTDDAYDKLVWRVASISQLSNRELTSGFSIEDIIITNGDTKTPTINSTPNHAIWANSDDFTYAMANTTGYTGAVTISGDNITGSAVGMARVKATHKVTGLITYFDVDVCKKAIIVLPGNMGSAIYAKTFDFDYDSSTYHFLQDDYLWDPEITITDRNRIRSSVLSLELHADGRELYPTYIGSPIVNNNKESYRKYGAKNYYKNMYLRLCADFSNTHDVILYEYDWRFDPYDTAVGLKDYIEENHYNDIVFVSHSMGGNVSSYYLALGEETRGRVDKHISVGTPYLGAEKLAYVYDTGDALDMYMGIDGLIEIDLASILDDPIKTIMPNIPAVYSLLPMETHFTPYLKTKNSNGEVTTKSTYSSTIDMLESQLDNWNVNFYNSAKSHQNLLFVNGEHITQLVDSYYIVGVGKSTAETIQITLNSSNEKIGDIAIDTYTMNSDGTVPLRSALINGTITENVLFKYSADNVSADHTGMIKGNDDQKTFDYICDVISGIDVNSLNEIRFFGKYSGYKELQ